MGEVVFFYFYFIYLIKSTGTYVKEKCTATQEKGICEPCREGTYTEHPTGMDQCLQCSQCPAGT